MQVGSGDHVVALDGGAVQLLPAIPSLLTYISSAKQAIISKLNMQNRWLSKAPLSTQSFSRSCYVGGSSILAHFDTIIVLRSLSHHD